MTVVAGLDVGTTGLKALAIAENGAILAEAQVPYAPQAPRSGWSEQDADDWAAAAEKACAALAAQGVRPAAIGLSGQMHGSVFLDAAERPIRPALLWNDQRTAAECDEIERRTGGRIVEWTLNPPRTAFTASKILWLRNAEPDAFARVRHVLLPKDHVRLAMTGTRATDVTDASGTNLFAVAARDWSAPALDALEIPADWMPPAVESPAQAGETSTRFAADTGLAAGIPLAGGGADQAAAAIGNGIVAPGAVSLTIGTSGVAYAQIDGLVIDPSESFHTFCHAVPGSWQVMAGVLSAAGSFQWFRETVGAAEADAADAAGRSGFDVLFEGIAAVPAGAGGLVFLPYLTGERSPHNDPFARGAFVGLTRRHDRRHMARAVIEGVCLALRDLVEGLVALKAPIAEIRVAGGAARSLPWLRILASVLGRPVRPTTTPDASAYGAGLMALALATRAGVAEVADACVAPGPAVEPDPADAALYAELHAVYRSLYAANRSAMHALARLDTAGSPA